MVDDHRRVEPRAVITGSGLTADPERIEELMNRAAQYERATAPQPKKKFGEVLVDDKDKRAQAKDPNAERKKEEARRRTEQERQVIRKLMANGTVHPGHSRGKSKVSFKG